MKQKSSSTLTCSMPFQNVAGGDIQKINTTTRINLNPYEQLRVDYLIQLITSGESQIWNSLCTECQNILTGHHDELDEYNSDWAICDDCGELLLEFCEYEELATHEYASTMRLLLHLKSFHRNDTSETKNTFYQTTEINKKINDLYKNIKTTVDNIQHLSSELINCKNSLEGLTQEYSSLNMKWQQQNILINKLKSNQDTSEQTFLAIQQKMEDFHYTTYDGTFIWKITNFARKFEEARSKRKTSIFSPLFCSSPTGYNMRLRLDIYGDGEVRGTHMSIFLVLCKGEYDPILPWPFDFPVIISLLDQTNQGYHIVDSFRPDPNSTSFQRPRSERNDANGIPKFCPLEAITRQANFYVQDDVMFIKAMLDFNGMPRQLYLNRSNFNYDLPTYEQEAIRRRDIEQYLQLRAALLAVTKQNDQEVSQRGLIPMQPQVCRIREQIPTDSSSISCEDIPDDE